LQKVKQGQGNGSTFSLPPSYTNLTYFVFFSFQAKSHTILLTSSIWECFLLKLSYLTWQARSYFCHILENCGGGPRGFGKGEIKACTKILSCMGWPGEGWDQSEGQTVWSTMFSISSCYYLLIHVPTLWHSYGLSQRHEAQRQRALLSLLAVWLFPSVSQTAWAARQSWQQPFVLAPIFPFTSRSFVFSNVMTEVKIQIRSRLLACGSGLRWWDATKIKKKKFSKIKN